MNVLVWLEDTKYSEAIELLLEQLLPSYNLSYISSGKIDIENVFKLDLMLVLSEKEKSLEAVQEIAEVNNIPCLNLNQCLNKYLEEYFSLCNEAPYNLNLLFPDNIVLHLAAATSTTLKTNTSSLELVVYDSFNNKFNFSLFDFLINLNQNKVFACHENILALITLIKQIFPDNVYTNLIFNHIDKIHNVIDFIANNKELINSYIQIYKDIINKILSWFTKKDQNNKSLFESQLEEEIRIKN